MACAAAAAAFDSMNASSSSDDDDDDDDALDDPDIYAPLRKKLRRRRKAAAIAAAAAVAAAAAAAAVSPGAVVSGAMKKPMMALNLETISDGESHSDGGGGRGAGSGGPAAVDSDCSASHLQAAMLSHLQQQQRQHNAGPGGGGSGPLLCATSDNHLIDVLSGAENDNGSYSSPLSNKSEKNMADFEDEDSPCEEELAQLAAASSHCLALNQAAQQRQQQQQRPLADTFMSKNTAAKVAAALNRSATAVCGAAKDAAAAANGGSIGSSAIMYRVTEVCQPGNTLLWDLLMDDKIGSLGESLALEAEKALGTLLCFNTEKMIRTKFIEGCLHNLAQNHSVIVSLRLLPKLLASFQQYRAADTHQVTMWAERNHRMMFHFFNNLKWYAVPANRQPVLNQAGAPIYSHLTQVQVRLQFLTSIFSTMGSPDSFRLSLEQVDALWEWLCNDAECADCLFAWLQSQAKGADQHALGIDTLQHLYLKKLPELKPEGISMVSGFIIY